MQPHWNIIAPLLAGYVADLFVGDPRHWPHPIRLYGYLIQKGTNLLNKGQHRFWKGLLLTLVLSTATYAFFAIAQASLYRWWPPAWYLFTSIFVWFALANKSLLQEGATVFDTL